MIQSQKVLAIIPARGGSKGILGKNIRRMGGKPLIAWTINAANESAYIDRTILSSDDRGIIEVAKRLGCDVPFVRPGELATDESGTAGAILHAVNTIEEQFDYIVVLQPTSPLRSAEDIDNCIRVCIEKKALSCVSVSKADKSPYWMYSVDTDGKMTPVIDTADKPSRRQDLPVAYTLNGAVYVIKVENFIKTMAFIDQETVAYIMPKERSIDIDTEFDILIFEALLQQGKEKGITSILTGWTS